MGHSSFHENSIEKCVKVLCNSIIKLNLDLFNKLDNKNVIFRNLLQERIFHCIVIWESQLLLWFNTKNLRVVWSKSGCHRDIRPQISTVYNGPLLIITRVLLATDVKKITYLIIYSLFLGKSISLILSSKFRWINL